MKTMLKGECEFYNTLDLKEEGRLAVAFFPAINFFKDAFQESDSISFNKKLLFVNLVCYPF